MKFNLESFIHLFIYLFMESFIHLFIYLFIWFMRRKESPKKDLIFGNEIFKNITNNNDTIATFVNSNDYVSKI